MSMTQRDRSLGAKLNDLVDWFVPAEIAQDRQKLKQVRMFLISHIFGPFIGNTVPLALYVFDRDPGYPVLVLALSISSFWIFPFVLRAWKHYNVLALASIQNLNFCILWSCYFYGGVTSPTLPWVLTIPLLALFYIGSEPKLRLIALSMFAANFAAFGGIWFFGGEMPSRLDVAAREGLGLVSTIAASLYIAMMALFYARLLASQTELETAMQGHLQTAAELREAIEATERAGAARTEFLAKMSHELRTPLNAIIGYSEILLETFEDHGCSQSKRTDLQRINAAGKHLLALVADVLDMSRIETQSDKFKITTFEVDWLAEDVVSTAQHLVEENGNKLSLICVGKLGTMQSDSTKVRQIILNLLGNAAKFTASGIVTLAVRRDAKPGGDWIEFQVRDTGIGISPEGLARLFQNFGQATTGIAGQYGGSGLGLSISQKLCVLMGGTISVVSELGKGSCFTVRLPAARSATETRPAEATGNAVPRLSLA